MKRLFESFFMGGFECATHRRRDRMQIDVTHVTGHDVRAVEDYSLLREAGVRTVRDGLRWHLIEREPGMYDWSSFLPLLEASMLTGTQVIWDLCHWGVPEWLDIFSKEFVTRFAAFAGAVARVIRARTGSVPIYCAINEISFWAWVGGDVETFYPHQADSGDVLKRQLVRASIAAIRAVRSVDSRARFVQPEPIIHVVPDDASEDPFAASNAAEHTEAQFQAWDMLRGEMAEELGGSLEMVDLIGVNFYWNNQWVQTGERLPLGNPYHKPLHVMLREIWERYRRPILLTETGAEAGAGVGWLGYICAEVRQAMREGIPVEGVCLYPVMDYPGWDDERHCRCGLIEVDSQWAQRWLREDLAAEMAVQAAAMGSERAVAELAGVR